MSDKKRVLVIGGGPGGYVAAIRAAQLGGDVSLGEKKGIGGTCFNVGSISPKKLLHASKIFTASTNAARWGVYLEQKDLNWSDMMAQKNAVVKQLVSGVSGLLDSNHVRVIQGNAQFTGPKDVKVQKTDGSTITLQADKILVASGSESIFPPVEGLVKGPNIIDSEQALQMDFLPESMMILGGGVIGVEMACVFQAFGCRTTIVEALPHIVPLMDRELSRMLANILSERGVTLKLNSKVVRVFEQADGVHVMIEANGEQRELVAQKLLVAVGRRAYTKDVGLERAGIQSEQGRILVNEYLETTAPGVYAIGDCLGQVMLAHTASAQGERGAENALGSPKPYRPACYPSCVYSLPEVAWVGLTEEQAQEKRLSYRVGRFPLAANGRALIQNGGSGIIKVLIGNELDEILGVHLLAPNATELIGEAALTIEMEATAQELIQTIHAHPTVGEALREAVLAADGQAIHITNKKRR